MTQMMEQWMPAFMEFSKVMSETSVELAKSRLQNEELSRMLKETRSQLDTMIAEQQKQQQQQPATPSPVKKLEQSSPSLEDWKALQESLHEVTATLKDFRKWLPSAMPPHPPPPPLFSHPPPIPTTQCVPQPGDMFNMLESQKAQMALSQLLQQQQRQMQQVTAAGVPPYMLPQPQREFK